MKFGDPGYRNAILRHQNRAFNAIHGNVGYLDNHLLHFWHGSRSSRGYGSRWKILRDYKFNPDTDIYRDSQGLWQLTKTKPEMRQAIRRYFLSRNEDRS